MFALNRLSILMNWIVVWEHEGLMQRRERELVDDHLKNTSRFGSSAKIRHPGLRSKSIGAKAIGALAVGALATGRLVIGCARIRRIEIDDLVTRRLHITEKTDAPDKSGAERCENARITPFRSAVEPDQSWSSISMARMPGLYGAAQMP